jgi:hypothetical protein
VPDFDALLIAVSGAAILAAVLAWRGHLTITLRRRPERKHTTETTP